MNQNNEDDYVTILGSVNKTYPSKLFGRGIIKTDSVYEFQTALITEKDNINSYINDLCDKIPSNALKAPTIKVLPEVVTYDDVKESVGIPNQFIVGINKNTLAPELVDYTKDCVNLVTTMDITLAFKLVKPIINQLLYQEKHVVFINAEDYSIDEKYTSYVKYTDSSFDTIFEELEKFVSDNYALYVSNGNSKKGLTLPDSLVVLINGMSSFKNKLSDENKIKLDEFFQHANELDLVNFILFDSIENVRKLEIDSWYKAVVNISNGIWVGNGINDQFSLKIVQKTKDIKGDIDDDFCIVLKRGKPSLVKILEEFDLKM